MRYGKCRLSEKPSSYELYSYVFGEMEFFFWKVWQEITEMIDSFDKGILETLGRNKEDYISMKHWTHEQISRA